jgi:hypothetical protein
LFATLEDVWIILDQSQEVIARHAQQAAYLIRLMVVVHGQFPLYASPTRLRTTDAAETILSFIQLVVFTG